MRIALIDPPLVSSIRNINWSRFAFSDIVWGYIRHLILTEYDHVYLVSSYNEPKEFTNTSDILIPARSWDVRNPANQYMLYRRYAKAVAHLMPDIIHSPDYYSLAVIAKTSKALPIVTTPGSICERKATFNPYGRWLTWTFEWATKVLKNKGALVLATSKYMAEWWETSGFPQERIFVVPLPTEVETQQVSRDEARKTLGWVERGLHILSVASLREEMRIDALIDLCRQYIQNDIHIDQSKKIDFHLHLVGDGELAAQIGELIKMKGMSLLITLHSHIPYHDLPLYYMASNALIVARRYNATPRAAQEPLSYGTPVIANLNKSLGGFSEELDQYIFQFDFYDKLAPVNLHNILEILFNNDINREHISRTSRNIFSAPVVSRKVTEIYRSAMHMYRV